MKWILLLIVLINVPLTGCATYLLHSNLEEDHLKSEYDAEYTISSVHQRNIEEQTALIVCFRTRLADTTEVRDYHVLTARRYLAAVIGSMGRMERSRIESGCSVPGGFQELEVSDKQPAGNADAMTDYWYVGSLQGCESRTNVLGCYASEGEIDYSEAFIVPFEYHDGRFDLRYVLYIPTVVIDTVMAPVYLLGYIFLWLGDGLRPDHLALGQGCIESQGCHTAPGSLVL